MKSSTFAYFMFIGFLLVGAFAITYQHEQVHVAINRNYGINSHVEYFSHFGKFVTVPDAPCPTDGCLLAHGINEIVGYTILPVYIILGMLLIWIIVQKEEELELKHKIWRDNARRNIPITRR